MKKKKTLMIIAISILLASIPVLVYVITLNKDNGKTNKTVKREKIEKKENPSPGAKSNKADKPDSKKDEIPTIANIEVNQPGKWGNNPGNILNGGSFALQDNYLYFSNAEILQIDSTISSVPICRSKEDGITALTKLQSNNYPHDLNLAGQWIYFVVAPDGDLCRIKLNGSELEIIDSGNIKNLIIFDNVLYYLLNDNLFKRSLNNLQEKQLLVENVSYFTFSQDGKTIFYCPLANNFLGVLSGIASNEIYSIDTKGENNRHIFTDDRETNIESFFVYKNYIYFTPTKWDSSTYSPEFSSYIVRLDYTSSDPKAEQFIYISEDRSSISLYENYLYYGINNYKENSLTLYRRNLDDDSVESLTINNFTTLCTRIQSFGDKVYFITLDKIDLKNTTSCSLYCLDFHKKSILRNKTDDFNIYGTLLN